MACAACGKKSNITPTLIRVRQEVPTINPVAPNLNVVRRQVRIARSSKRGS